MTFATLARSFLLNLVLLPTIPTAQAATPAPRLQLQAVELVGYVGDALKVAVELPCGSEFYGLVLVTPEPTKGAKKKLIPGKGRLEIAAAVLQDAIVCTTITEPKTIVADFVATRSFDVIAPFAVDGLNPRIVVSRLTDLKVRTGRSGITATTVEAIYQTKCGSALGALVRPGGGGRLEIGIVEKPSRPGSGRGDDCAPKTQRSMLTALSVEKHEVSALPEKPGSLGRAFTLRYATVKKGSVKRGVDRGVSMTYKRACNEAPVGIVMKDLGKGKDGKRQVELGVLVAHYYNLPCKNLEGKGAEDRIADQDLRLGKSVGLKMKATGRKLAKGEALLLKTPTALTMGGEGGIQVGYVRPCGQVDGAIYARDARGKLSVGVVVASRGKCVRRGASGAGASEVSLYQPFVAERVRTAGLAPLRLKGQPAH